MTPRLSKGASKVIDTRLDDLFDMLKVKLLGPTSVGRRLYVGFTHELSIPGIFERAVSEEGGKLDTTLLDHLVEITGDFIDKARADAKAQAKKRIQDTITDFDNGRLTRKEFEPKLEEELGDIWASVTANVARVVTTQTQQAQTLGIKSGLDQINANLGVEDPVVCFIPVKDHVLCDECKRLHLLEDLNTPRVWLSSEVKSGYHKKGDPEPSWSLLHPHCRCALTTVLPGFGFQGGRIAWIGDGHDEWAHQRGEKSRFAKSETMYGEFLAKSTRKGVRTFKAYRSNWKHNHDNYQADEPLVTDEWLKPPSGTLGPRHAIYWALHSPQVLAYRNKLNEEERRLFDMDVNEYGASPIQRYGIDPTHSWVKQLKVNGDNSLDDYISPEFHGYEERYFDPVTGTYAKMPPHKAGTKSWETSEEAAAALKAAGYDGTGWSHPYSSFTVGYKENPNNHQVEALLDELVPDWRDYKAADHRLHPKVVDAFKKGKVKINVPSGSLDGIIAAGRWQNLFETGTGRGNKNTDMRLEFETNLGLPESLEELPATERPVYGWFDFITPLAGHRRAAKGVDQYGDVVVHLKDHVKNRATITVGDSSSVEPEHVFLAKEGAHAAAHAMAGNHTKHWNNVAEHGDYFGKDIYSDVPGWTRVTHSNKLPRFMQPENNYVESQIHGGIYPRTDIESVHVSGNNQRAMGRAKKFAQHFRVPLYDSDGEKPTLVWHPDMEKDTETSADTIANDLTKSFKGAVAGMAMGLAAMVPGKVANPPMEHKAPVVTVKDHPFNAMVVPELNQHLKAISFLETSGGKFQNHAKDPRGDYWTAHGALGFKPAVAHEFYNKHKGLQQAFPGLKDPKAFTHAFKTYPAVYNSIANTYWGDLMAKVKDPGLAAFKWRNGKYANQVGWRNHEYVRRFTDLFIPVNERVADSSVPFLDDLKLSQHDWSWLEPLEKSLRTRTVQEFIDEVLIPFGWSVPDVHGPADGTGHWAAKHVSGMVWKGFGNEDKRGDLSPSRQDHFLRQLKIKHVDDHGQNVFGYLPGTDYEHAYAAVGAPSTTQVKDRIQRKAALRAVIGANANPYVIDGADPLDYKELSKIQFGLTEDEMSHPNFKHRASLIDLSKPEKVGHIEALEINGPTTTQDEKLHRLITAGYTHAPVKMLS